MNQDDFIAMVKRHEGTGPMTNGCHCLYVDTVGKHTIGYGRNLDDNGLTEEEAMYLLQNDLGRARQQARQAFPWFDWIDPTAQQVVTELVFNMGIGKYELFHQMHMALDARDYQKAASALLDSLYAKEVPARAQELAGLLQGLS